MIGVSGVPPVTPSGGDTGPSSTSAPPVAPHDERRRVPGADDRGRARRPDRRRRTGSWRTARRESSRRALEGVQQRGRLGAHVGERARRAPEAAHRRRRVEAAPDDVAHDHADAPVAQREHVVPVAADLEAAGGREVAHRDVDVLEVREPRRQQRALQHDCGIVLGVVASGSVEGARAPARPPSRAPCARPRRSRAHPRARGSARRRRGGRRPAGTTAAARPAPRTLGHRVVPPRQRRRQPRRPGRAHHLGDRRRHRQVDGLEIVGRRSRRRRAPAASCAASSRTSTAPAVVPVNGGRSSSSARPTSALDNDLDSRAARPSRVWLRCCDWRTASFDRWSRRW